MRPWTVADFTSQWLRQALDGEPVAVISFLLIPIISGFMAWIELRPKLRKMAARKRASLKVRGKTSDKHEHVRISLSLTVK